MSIANRLLNRQLKQHKIDSETVPTKEQWNAFLKSLERTYLQNEDDRYLLERSLSISSREMKEAMQRQKELNAQLTQAEKFSSMGTLASGIAHQLGGPISGIRSYSQMILREKNLNQNDQDHFEKIIVLTQKMSELVSNLLRLNGGPVEIDLIANIKESDSIRK